ncbi:hypothetical protein [Streptomyces sp. CBG9]|uniref:hypothetical protein n=1 Tax=Streptomyces sp. CBG9 TaxID=2762622 RepID=UPI00164869D7|nr:hypothetical protein [Streptomyces sp. CBG9]
MRTQDDSAHEEFEEFHVTVIYTGMREPEVHATGCADIARTTKPRDVHSEELTAADAHAVSAHVYADQIAEGENAEDLISALDFKPCVRMP